MTLVGAILGCVLGFAIAWALTRPRPPARPARVDECVCGLEVWGDALHLVVSAGEDDEHLGITGGRDGGGTFMAAAFCAEHCPGGCLRGCPDLA